MWAQLHQNSEKFPYSSQPMPMVDVSLMLCLDVCNSLSLLFAHCWFLYIIQVSLPKSEGALTSSSLPTYSLCPGSILCSSPDFLASETSYLFILLCIHSPPTICLLWSEWQLYDSRSSTYRWPLSPSTQEWALPKNMSNKEEMSKSVVLMVVLQSCLISESNYNPTHG